MYIPVFESSHYTTSLLWEIYTSTCFGSQKKFTEFFVFTKKLKSENSFQHLCCSGLLTEAVCARSSKSGPSKLLALELHSVSQHEAAIPLNFICEHLYFISIYCVHPLARYVLRSQKSLREVMF